MIIQAAGIDMEFVQDNQSSSKKGVFKRTAFSDRIIHKDKLVRVV